VESLIVFINDSIENYYLDVINVDIAR